MMGHGFSCTKDPGSPRLASGLGGKLPQQGPKADATALSLSFELMTHIVIKTDGVGNTHSRARLINEHCSTH